MIYKLGRFRTQFESKRVSLFLKTYFRTTLKALRSDVTGLPLPIWLQPKTGKEKHGPRIKVSESQRVGQNWAGSITISENPQLLNWKKRIETKAYIVFVKKTMIF